MVGGAFGRKGLRWVLSIEWTKPPALDHGPCLCARVLTCCHPRARRREGGKDTGYMGFRAYLSMAAK